MQSRSTAASVTYYHRKNPRTIVNNVTIAGEINSLARPGTPFQWQRPKTLHRNRNPNAKLGREPGFRRRSVSASGRLQCKGCMEALGLGLAAGHCISTN